MVVVGEAKSGDEALDMDEEARVGCRVLDYAMPRCSGASW